MQDKAVNMSALSAATGEILRTNAVLVISEFRVSLSEGPSKSTPTVSNDSEEDSSRAYVLALLGNNVPKNYSTKINREWEIDFPWLEYDENY